MASVRLNAETASSMTEKMTIAWRKTLRIAQDRPV